MDNLDYLTKRYIELGVWHYECIRKGNKLESKIVKWFMKYYFDKMVEVSKKK